MVAREANERQVSCLLFDPSEFSRKEKTTVKEEGREESESESESDEKLAKPQGGLQKASLRLATPQGDCVVLGEALPPFLDLGEAYS